MVIITEDKEAIAMTIATLPGVHIINKTFITKTTQEE